MNNNETSSNEQLNDTVNVSFFGLGPVASWIIFAILIVASVIFLPYLLNLLM